MTQQTLDPRQFWLVQTPKEQWHGETVWFFLQNRESGEQFAPRGPLPEGMPQPFSLRRKGDGTPHLWWVIFDEDLESALMAAKEYGFRMNEEDISLYGDPGLVVKSASATKIAGVETMRGRPGDVPFTLVRAATITTSPFGEEDIEIISANRLIQILGNGSAFDDEYESGVAFEGSIQEAWDRLTPAGFEPRAEFPACMRPDQMEVFIEMNEDGMVEMIYLSSKTSTVWDDDMRDGVIAWLPDGVGDNIAESCWEPKNEISEQDMKDILIKAGYTITSKSPF